MKSTNDKIKQQLVEYRIKCDMALSEREDGVVSQKEYESMIARQANINATIIAKLIKETLQECIGEETLQTIEYKTAYGTPKTGKRKRAGWKIRNQLRQEALTKLKEMMK